MNAATPGRLLASVCATDGKLYRPLPTRGRRESDAIEKASASDRAYFQKNPGIKQRTRVGVPGEFGRMSVSSLFLVEVTEVCPGVRVRVPLLFSTVGERQ